MLLLDFRSRSLLINRWLVSSTIIINIIMIITISSVLYLIWLSDCWNQSQSTLTFLKIIASRGCAVYIWWKRLFWQWKMFIGSCLFLFLSVHKLFAYKSAICTQVYWLQSRVKLWSLHKTQVPFSPCFECMFDLVQILWYYIQK